ncbi:phytanoyl-CoA dioxygenase family protein [Xenophilus sp. Marseille-Q4582]|uniref:phytanoyl-CoA dioxygenase family protein n=1 Tax=Xenophilus sp. Marseille-Q4582 TaxID=2866600 RepID=UPI001CE3F35A|nr:phytanoyl-CoA dioxygenase family protein [Xenophilus sp. Marseille-Q4582]
MQPADLARPPQPQLMLDDPATWRRLAPALHVQDTAFLSDQQPLALDADALAQVQRAVREDGYFHLPPQPWNLPTQAMADAIRRLDAQGIPLPFAFVYDEFWLLFWRMHRVLEGLLGPAYLRLPDFWAWLIDPQRNDSGWRPHRDRSQGALFDDGSPRAFTLWLPLTDATPDTSCMYVVPAQRDPTYGKGRIEGWQPALADIRALPAAAGSALGWTQELLHWGSSARPRETRVRISVAMEFQSAQTPPFNQPLMAADQLPAFAMRLQLIGKQILQYRHMYPLSDAVADLAQRLQAGLAAPAR